MASWTMMVLKDENSQVSHWTCWPGDGDGFVYISKKVNSRHPKHPTTSARRAVVMVRQVVIPGHSGCIPPRYHIYTTPSNNIGR